jgi:hypothetical protein
MVKPALRLDYGPLATPRLHFTTVTRSRVEPVNSTASGGTLGRGNLSGTAVGNRRGYAGSELPLARTRPPKPALPRPNSTWREHGTSIIIAIAVTIALIFVLPLMPSRGRTVVHAMPPATKATQDELAVAVALHGIGTRRAIVMQSSLFASLYPSASQKHMPPLSRSTRWSARASSILESGWPFLAASCWWSDSALPPIGGIPIGGSIPVHHDFGGWFRWPRAIPLIPLWTGLIANVAIFYLMTVTSRKTVHHIYNNIVCRRRRARMCCTKCGYERPTVGPRRCPECGAFPGSSADKSCV